MAKLQVWNFYKTGPNSAGGVSVNFSFKNLTEKTIKYAYFWFTPYNAVQDKVNCSIRRESTRGVKYTGPLSPGATNYGALFENAWYNNSITSVRLSHVLVEYMDGTEERVEVTDIDFSAPAVTSTSGGGCYVATAVYGSYDCPQVWTLRRYRDYTLAEKWYGRLFIKTYYLISPIIVKCFGQTKWFKNIWKPRLDKLVRKLNAQGVDNTPYNDKEW